MGEKTPAVRWPSRPRLSGGGGGWRLADSLGYVGLATWSAWCLPGVWSPSCVLWRPPSEAVALHGVGMSREPRGGGRQGGLQEGGFLWPLCFLSCAPGCVSCAAGTPVCGGDAPALVLAAHGVPAWAVGSAFSVGAGGPSFLGSRFVLPACLSPRVSRLSREPRVFSWRTVCRSQDRGTGVPAGGPPGGRGCSVCVCDL